MSDLYRRLLHDITERFGGTVDDANADAIAYAAAELYHRDFEPHLWEGKSAHDLLDLFGIPRAGVFAPYSLSDRLLLFQRRSSQAQYVTRAHEVLSALGVPRQDENGSEQSLRWRIEKVMASVNGEAADAGGDGAGSKDEDKAAEGKSDEDSAEREQEGTDEETSGAKEAEDAGRQNGAEEEQPAPGFAPLAQEPPEEASDPLGAALSSAEPSPAQLVEAVRALEQAAELEAELATPAATGEPPTAVDLVGLTETLSGIQGEIAALRDLVEAFELGMRRQLDELQTQLRAAGPGVLASSAPPDSSGPAPLIPRPVDPTHEMAPVDVEEQARSSLLTEGEAGIARRRGRRTLLVVLLALLGMLIAGGIAVAVAVGWETIRPDPAGLLLPLGGGLAPP